MKAFLFILFLSLGVMNTLHAQTHFPRHFHKVSDKLYRSGQPNTQQMQAYEALGVVTDLNLRYRINDKHELRNTSIVEKRVRMRAKDILLNDVREALRTIRASEGPVLVHCLHGSDRTGCIVAVYRMVEQGWTKAQAIDEFQNELFGYNKKWFPNILSFLEDLDVEALIESL